MTDTKDSTDKTFPGGRKPLSLQRTVESGHVRQNFSHGRSKAVVVEKRKSRKLVAPGQAGDDQQAATPAAAPAQRAAQQAPSRQAQRRPAQGVRPAPGGDAGDKLSSSELEARQRALLAAKAQQEAEAARAAEEALKVREAQAQ